MQLKLKLFFKKHPLLWISILIAAIVALLAIALFPKFRTLFSEGVKTDIAETALLSAKSKSNYLAEKHFGKRLFETEGETAVVADLYREKPLSFASFMPQDIPPLIAPSLPGEGRFMPVYNSPPESDFSPLAAIAFLRTVSYKQGADLAAVKFASYALRFHANSSEAEAIPEALRSRLESAIWLPPQTDARADKQASETAHKLIITEAGKLLIFAKEKEDLGFRGKAVATLSLKRAIIERGEILREFLESGEAKAQSNRRAIGTDREGNFSFFYGEKTIGTAFANAALAAGAKTLYELEGADKGAGFFWFWTSETDIKWTELSDFSAPDFSTAQAADFKGRYLYITKKIGLTERLQSLLPQGAAIVTPPPPETFPPRPSFWARGRFTYEGFTVDAVAVALNGFKARVLPGSAWKPLRDFKTPSLPSILPPAKTALACELLTPPFSKVPGLLVSGEALSDVAKKEPAFIVDQNGKLSIGSVDRAEERYSFLLQPSVAKGGDKISGFYAALLPENTLLLLMSGEITRKAFDNLKKALKIEEGLFFEHPNPSCAMISGLGLKSDQIFLSSPPPAGPTLVLIPSLD